METRRTFIKKTSITLAALPLAKTLLAQDNIRITAPEQNNEIRKPMVISTWKHGIPANEAAWKILKANGRALDAVEQGVRVPEADPNVKSVGYGGLPDRDGHLTLDACIIDEFGNCGSVAYIEYIMHPTSVARKVMENTPHVMLVGRGALKFALDNGFKKENLLTEDSKKLWLEWKKKENYKPDDIEIHDTIGMLAIDNKGNLSGACTTSGLAWKYNGRVGDSPIIGAGLYVDNEVGGACSTGVGESVIKICGSFLIVELMRNGASPQEACEKAVRRIASKQKLDKNFQVAFLALNKKGEIGAYSYAKGFQYALYIDDNNKLYDSEHLVT